MHVVVVRRTGGNDRDAAGGRDRWYHEVDGAARRTTARPSRCRRRGPAVHPLHLGLDRQAERRAAHHRRLSASTRRSRIEYVFDYRDGDMYWCTADVGWVTGHSYIVYGPLANGATTLMFEGVPNYPDASRFWQVVDKHQVDIFYTAPTAIRALMREGDAPVKRTSRKIAAPARHGRRADQSRSVGVVSPRRRRRPLPDRRHLVADRDRRHPDHAAAGRDRAQAGLGDAAVLRRRAGDRRRRTARCSKARPKATSCCSTAGRARCAPCTAIISASSTPTSSTYPGKYFTGDGARRDEDGYYWITGRVDDVINVAGHRLGTAEVESALVAHAKVAEAAVVGYPARHQGPGHLRLRHAEGRREPTEELRKELRRVGAQGDRRRSRRPTSSSGRRACRRRARARSCAASCARSRRTTFEQLGDTSTLADPAVVDDLPRRPRQIDKVKPPDFKPQ